MVVGWNGGCTALWKYPHKDLLGILSTGSLVCETHTRNSDPRAAVSSNRCIDVLSSARHPDPSLTKMMACCNDHPHAVCSYRSSRPLGGLGGLRWGRLVVQAPLVGGSGRRPQKRVKYTFWVSVGAQVWSLEDPQALTCL